MIKSIIIEDENQARQGLKKMLKLIAPQVEIIGEAGDLRAAQSLIEGNDFDLIFLDIQLEDGTAFDLLGSLESLPKAIIFTTAHNEYAIQAFKVHAIDYLLKPISPGELLSAVTIATKRIEDEQQLQNLLLSVNNQRKEQKIILKTNRERYVINANQIIRLQAEGAYTTFVTNKKRILVSKNLLHYEKQLIGDHFLRIHQSHLININALQSINADHVLMNNEEKVPFSIRKKHTLMKIFFRYNTP